MRNYEKSTRITLYANRIVFVVMTLLLFFFPVLVERYHQHFRPLLDSGALLLSASIAAPSGSC